MKEACEEEEEAGKVGEWARRLVRKVRSMCKAVREDDLGTEGGEAERWTKAVAVAGDGSGLEFGPGHRRRSLRGQVSLAWQPPPARQ